jgi:SIR2-like domain
LSPPSSLFRPPAPRRGLFLWSGVRPTSPRTTRRGQTLAVSGTGRSAITWRNRALAAIFFREPTQDVLHLHGYYRQVDSIILGARSYGEICRDEFAQTALRGLMISGTLVFVGCGAGLEDPNFGGVFYEEGERGFERLGILAEMFPELTSYGATWVWPGLLRRLRGPCVRLDALSPGWAGSTPTTPGRSACSRSFWPEDELRPTAHGQTSRKKMVERPSQAVPRSSWDDF